MGWDIERNIVTRTKVSLNKGDFVRNRRYVKDLNNKLYNESLTISAKVVRVTRDLYFIGKD